jgi:hypothetical protein
MGLAQQAKAVKQKGALKASSFFYRPSCSDLLTLGCVRQFGVSALSMTV